mgnify:CR=1 FL=1
MKKILLTSALSFACALSFAQNPIISTSYTPDPAPYVHGDKLYMFVGHDEDDATYFKMNDWQVFSTEDMVNWTYLGTPISTETFKWAFHGDRAWASQAIERNGKWYWYVCLNDAEKNDVRTVLHLHPALAPFKAAVLPLSKKLSEKAEEIFSDLTKYFSVDYDEAFGFEAELHPKNIIDHRHFEIKTPDVTIKVHPDRSDLVETRIIDGARYILIRAEEEVEVNGIPVQIF